MTALQELSLKLSLFTRSLTLSTLRKSTSQLHGRHRSLHIHVSSSASSRSFVEDSYFPVLLFGGGCCRHISAGGDDLKIGALDRSDRAPYIADDLSFSDSRISDDEIDSRTEQLHSANGSEEETEDVPNSSSDSGLADDFNYVQKNRPTKEPKSANYLTMSDKQLFSKCRMDTYRASGPGGQHRNKTDSAVRLTHIPTGLVSQAADDRSQHINRSLALTRLRQTIALEVRDPVELIGYKAPPELVRILPSGTGGKRGNSQRIGPNHPDFILGMKALMDLLHATGGSVSDAGKILGLSTGATSKLITSNDLLWQGVNKLRSSKVMVLPGSEASEIMAYRCCAALVADPF